MEMKVRPYRTSDLSAVLAIYRLSKLDELRFESEKSFELLPLERDAKRFAELFESQIVVLEQQGKLLGYGAYLDNEIRALFTHPDARGRGVGRQILEHLLNEVGESALLYVASSNQPAKRLYRRYGFTEVDAFMTEYNGVEVMANTMQRWSQSGDNQINSEAEHGPT